MISISYVHLCIPAHAAKKTPKTLNLGLPQQMCKYESFQCMCHIYWDKSMISKYKKPHVLFIRFNTCMYLLSSLYFLPLRSFFHLRGKKPFKWTPTKTINNNNNKALSRGATHFCFHKCDKSNGATLFSVNKLDQSWFIWFILGWFWPVEKSYRPKPTMFWQICQQLGFVHRCKMMSSTATCMSSKLPCGAMITRAASFICL